MANTTWNASDKTTNITLGGTNSLTATANTTGGGGVRTIDRQVTGQFYFEFTPSSITGTIYLGVGAANVALTSSTNGYSVFFSSSSTSQYWLNGVQTGFGGSLGSAISNGTTTCIALDLTNQLIWFRQGAAGNW